MLAPTKPRKQNYQKSKKNSKKQRLQAYLQSDDHSQEIYGESLQKYLSSQGISHFFDNLHEHLHENMLVTEKKNTILPDGVYILLEGQLTYVWVQHRYDRDRKEHLFSLAKNNSFSNISESPYDVHKNLNTGYSILISKPFSIIQCQMGNFMANEDCSLVKLDQRVLEMVHFQKIKWQRIQLIQQCRFHFMISQEYFPDKEAIFNVNTSMHHTIAQKNVYFHNKFTIDTFGIVVDGIVSLRLLDGKKIQMTRASALLPSLQYEVCSASAKIMEFKDNPTFYYKNPEAIKLFLSYNVEGYTKSQTKKQKFCSTFSSINKSSINFSQMGEKENNYKIEMYRSKISNSLLINRNNPIISSKVSDVKKRRRQVNNVSKECESYCIIPMQFCKQNLKFTKDINKKNTPKQQKLRNPQILFNLSKKSFKKLKPISPFLRNKEEETDNKKQDETRSNKKLQLMNRYQIFSKQMYDRFMVVQRQNRNETDSKYRLGDKKSIKTEIA